MGGILSARHFGGAVSSPFFTREIGRLRARKGSMCELFMNRLGQLASSTRFAAGVVPGETASCNSPGGTHSRLYECEEIGVNLIGVRSWHAMRKTGIGLECAMLQQFDGPCSGSSEGANLLVLSMHYKDRNIDHLEFAS
jgi:hypothetical protein